MCDLGSRQRVGLEINTLIKERCNYDNKGLGGSFNSGRSVLLSETGAVSFPKRESFYCGIANSEPREQEPLISGTEGAKPMSAAISRHEVTIDGVRRVLRWQEVGKWANKAFEASGPAQPFGVPGGAVNAQEISFEPRSKGQTELLPGETEDINWFEWDKFLQFLSKASSLQVHCVVELHGGKTLTSDVELQLHPGVKSDLQNPKRRWAAAACKKL